MTEKLGVTSVRFFQPWL